jgi:hypothetical protein
MIEFYIPEPGMSLLQKQVAMENSDYPDPGPFTLRIEDIDEETYTYLASKYGTGELETPPQKNLSTSFSWKSSVEEGAEGYGEETAEGVISIPKGYYAGVLYYSFASFSNDNYSLSYCNVSLAVGGLSIVNSRLKNITEIIDLSRFSIHSEEGIAVSIRVSQHWDKTATVNLRLNNNRTEEFFEAWKLRIFHRCKQKHDELKSIYLRKKEEAAFIDQSKAIGRSELENFQTIQNELKKWCIKALRGESFDFNDTVLYNSLMESDPFAALQTQPYIWFHENSFEWKNMVYLFYPYFWGNRNQWRDKIAISENDILFQEFLQAGYAKVIVPVNPDAEALVLRYVSNPEVTEAALYEDALRGNPDSQFDDLWMELLQDKVDGLARGSGTLTVTKDNSTATINPDSTWVLTIDDINRILVIEGVEYRISSISTNKIFEMERVYERSDNATAKYFIKGKRIGSPWLVSVPTQLNVSHEKRYF